MAIKAEITVSRVGMSAYGIKVVDGMGFKPLKYPEPGFVFQTNLPGSVPIYISRSDVKRIKQLKEGESWVAESWESGE